MTINGQNTIGGSNETVIKKARHVSTSTADLISFGKTHVTRGINRLTEGILSNGKGSFVEYEGGSRLLHFTSGIGVTSLGQLESITLHRPYLELVERLLPFMPHSSLDSFFWTSGSEAIEAAIEMCDGCHQKRDHLSEGTYPRRPIMPGVVCMPYPYWHQHGLPSSMPSSVLVSQSLYQLDLLAQQASPKDTAAIIIEPFLGEGGYVQAAPEFLQGLRELCDKHGMLLIIDEVQSGFGRRGKFFNIKYRGVRPDIMVIAKLCIPFFVMICAYSPPWCRPQGLANGYPLSGVVSRKDLTNKLQPGTLGGTYADNAIACAAAIAVADALIEENIIFNVRVRSADLFGALEELRADPTIAPYILDVRGTGLMVAVEFTSPCSPGAQFDPVTKKDSPKTLA
ncbi:hypothetical protein DXG01_014482 [Tephrocybe rancida]|nr:hypothetical protein DXG01_014482 [Tephrocybe rancida]